MHEHRDESDLVRPEDACPNCGERDVDRLIWVDDDCVRCATCGTDYNPLEQAPCA
ncbi:MAG: hypothetical protein H6819_07075 [Phycisphaerales bacterium]|nr:hypothetical protein [Phycisphaerales bacterium]MCB9855344.1 hypothetical protein [Phycisphaerales bacterium]MCB9862937.1 hypothetical protein [Phycisphaerales bacterium]